MVVPDLVAHEVDLPAEDDTKESEPLPVDAPPLKTPLPVLAHSLPVITHKNEPFPSGEHLNVNGPAAGINRVFNQLFDYRCGTFHDLARGDFVG